MRRDLGMSKAAGGFPASDGHGAYGRLNHGRRFPVLHTINIMNFNETLMIYGRDYDTMITA